MNNFHAETNSIKYRLQDSIYVICNVITIVLVVVKIFILLIYNEELLDIIDYAKINFWHLNYDSHEQMIVDNCRRTCTIFVCVFTFFAQGTVIGFIARPLLSEIFENKIITNIEYYLSINGTL